MRVDLNADLGEEITDDAALLRVISSANVACGYHAGSAEIMRVVCAQAAGLGVSIGAQVSYDDRDHFGRRPVEVAYELLREQVADQVGTLTRIAVSEGVGVRYVKPHGALYHRVLDDDTQARAVLDGSGDLPVLGMVPGVFVDLAARAGRTVWSEAFPDRGYTPEGRLVPRGAPGDLIEGAEAVARRAVVLASQGRIDSLCLHGDSPGAVATAVAVRRALASADFTVCAP